VVIDVTEFLELTRYSEAHGLLLLSYGDDLDPDIHLWLDSQKQQARWFHAELSNIKAGDSFKLKSLFIEARNVHEVLVVTRHAAKCDVTADAVLTGLFTSLNVSEHPFNGWKAPSIYSLLQLTVLEPVA
jgi:hypothetical protein